MTLLTSAAPTLFVLLLQSCSNTPPGMVSILYQSSNCGMAAPGLAAIEGESALDRVVSDRGSRPGRRLPDELQPDFSQQNVFVLSMGQKPSAGYRLILDSQQSGIRGQVFHVAVQKAEPAPGTVTASVLTAPCVVFALPKNGYSEVEAGDYRLEI